jgi:hypothetical protein
VASGCAAALGVELIHDVDCLGHFLRISTRKPVTPGSTIPATPQPKTLPPVFRTRSPP